MSDSGDSGVNGSAIVPGWYADPYIPGQLRWWDGAQWTDQVAPLPTATTATAATAPPATSAPDDNAGSDDASAPPVTEKTTDTTAAAFPSRRALREAGTQYRAPESANEAQQATNVPVAEPQVTEQQAPEPQVTEQQAPEPQAPEPQVPEAAVPEQATPPTLTPTDPLSIFEVQEHTTDASIAADLDRDRDRDEVSSEDAEANTLAAPARPMSAWDIPPVASDGMEEPAPSSEPAAESAIDWGLAPRTRRSTGSTSAAQSTNANAFGNVWTWLIVCSPVIAAITVGYVLATVGADLGNWMFPAAFVLPYLLVLLFAVADRSGLIAEGHDDAVPWTWAALTAPVYLYLRMGFVRRNGGTGTLPLLVWAIVFVLSIVGVLGYRLLTNHSG